jgi:hypothetical protein
MVDFLGSVLRGAIFALRATPIGGCRLSGLFPFADDADRLLLIGGGGPIAYGYDLDFFLTDRHLVSKSGAYWSRADVEAAASRCAAGSNPPTTADVLGRLGVRVFTLLLVLFKADFGGPKISGKRLNSILLGLYALAEDDAAVCRDADRLVATLDTLLGSFPPSSSARALQLRCHPEDLAHWIFLLRIRL